MALSSSAKLGAEAFLNPSDRRKFPRSSQRYEVRVRSEKPDQASVVMTGTLINVSLGGALFSLGAYMSPQEPCSVEIYGAAGRVIPNKTLAHVIHTSLGPSGDYQLRVEFVKPLKSIKEPGEM